MRYQKNKDFYVRFLFTQNANEIKIFICKSSWVLYGSHLNWTVPYWKLKLIKMLIWPNIKSIYGPKTKKLDAIGQVIKRTLNISDDILYDFYDSNFFSLFLPKIDSFFIGISLFVYLLLLFLLIFIWHK